MRRTGKEGLYQRIVPKKRRQDVPPPVDHDLPWCCECDPEFPCYDGKAACIRDSAEETKWDST